MTDTERDEARELIRTLQPIIERCADTHHWRVSNGKIGRAHV